MLIISSTLPSCHRLLLPSRSRSQQVSRPPESFRCLGRERRRWRVSERGAAHRLVLLVVMVGLDEELVLAGCASDGVKELDGRC